MKKIMLIFLILLMFMTPLLSFGELDIDSKAAVLMDYNTGEIVYKINEDLELSPASITKIMTLLLTMEALDSGKLNLQDEIIISEYASNMGGTQVYLEPGEAQNVENLIKAVCIRSANDAAVALGEAVGGSYEVFINLMNERANELNMNHSNFVNAHGLPAENHYTTAKDVAIMTRELLKHDKIIEYLTIYMEDITVGKDKDKVQTMVNTNRLVRNYEGITGVKTGSTNDAGYCLSASAKRDDMQLIAVVLGAENSTNRFEDATKLLDYGFATYDSVLLEKKDSIIAEMPIEKGTLDYIDLILERDSYVIVPRDQENEINKDLVIPDSLLAPVEKGDIVGKLNVYINDDEIDSVNVISNVDVKESNYLNLLKKTVKTFISND